MANALPKTPAITIENVGYKYKSHEAIQDINFDVQSGEVFGLVGLNGAGKTTLMKSILGLLQDYDGNIEIYGKDAASNESRKKLAFLPEKFEPSWFLTGREFITFACSFYNQKVDDELLHEAADLLELKQKFLDQRVKNYSKGMRQKLGLISCFLSACPLIMLDEPMSGLDPRARIFVKKEILKARQAGRTVFFSSHIMADVDELCDRIAVIHNTKLCFLGTPTDLKKQYKGANLEMAFLNMVDQTDRNETDDVKQASA